MLRTTLRNVLLEIRICSAKAHPRVLGEGARDRLEKSSFVREAACESCPALVVLQLAAVWPRADTKIRVVKKNTRVCGIDLIKFHDVP